jgi:hypothetical protein
MSISDDVLRLHEIVSTVLIDDMYEYRLTWYVHTRLDVYSDFNYRAIGRNNQPCSVYDTSRQQE